jgi:primosomal protein N' (replication factor Y)
MGAVLVLGSATPSLPSYYRAENGIYQLYPLKTRAKNSKMAQVEVVDMRKELQMGNRSMFSGLLSDAIKDRLQKDEQVMLFINRRGINGFLSCRSCGHVLKCPHCDVSLSEHKNGQMVCHYCGYTTAAVKTCPECGSGYIGGFKAGTQKIEELLREQFPQAKILRMDADTTKKKDSHEQILSAFANQEAQILVGTQMIVKGHDFPNVTLVGVLAADLSLYAGDYRSAEKTFQLLTQAAGRAGRGRLFGEAVIQTYNPEHYAIVNAAKQSYEDFYKEEVIYRQMLKYPPIWNMMVILVSSQNEALAEKMIQGMYAWLSRKQIPKLALVGPAKPAVAKVNDRYRDVLYMKHDDIRVLIGIKDEMEQRLTGHPVKDISVQFDIR